MAILLTTSLRPSQRTRSLCNDLVACCAAFSIFMRGKSSLAYLFEYAKNQKSSKLWILHSRFGSPSLIECYDLGKTEPSVSFLVKRVQLIRELGVRSPKGTRHRPLALAPPDTEDLRPLYECMKLALGDCASPVTGDKATEVHIQFSSGTPEIFFIDSISKLPCGPAIYLKSFRCNA
ncbi:MAG: hypothetical protein H5T33_03770 [Candidatus Methanosuratus sp.]|nr:hypothetical protein [Candidatus Methanosuratincola sp.]